MPITCSSSVSALTGQDGSLWFRPPGGSITLDQSVFQGPLIFVGPIASSLLIGDTVLFESSGLTGLPRSTPQVASGTAYYIVAINDPQADSIQISETNGGPPITFNLVTPFYGSALTECVVATGADYDNSDIDNGVDSICTDAPGYNSPAFNPGIADYDNADVFDRWAIDVPGTDFTATEVVVSILPEVVCQVREFSAELTRDELDSTVLPCSFSGASVKQARFRSFQSGYAGLSGTATLLVTDEQASAATKMMKAVLDRVQTGAVLKLYINTVVKPSGAIDDNGSLLVEFPCAITGMSLAVTPDDLTTAEISFSATCQPTQLFGQV